MSEQRESRIQYKVLTRRTLIKGVGGAGLALVGIQDASAETPTAISSATKTPSPAPSNTPDVQDVTIADLQTKVSVKKQSDAKATTIAQLQEQLKPATSTPVPTSAQNPLKHLNLHNHPYQPPENLPPSPK